MRARALGRAFFLGLNIGWVGLGPLGTSTALMLRGWRFPVLSPFVLLGPS